MVDARVLDKYIHFSFMYTTHHIFPISPIQQLTNQDGEPTTPPKLETGMKPPVSNIRVLFCMCAIHRVTEQVYGKALNMCH